MDLPHAIPEEPKSPPWDLQEKVAWVAHLSTTKDSPERALHQKAFKREQGAKRRQGTLTDSVTREELVQHYLWFGVYNGFYLVEVPSSYLRWLLGQPACKDRFRCILRLVLDLRHREALYEPEDERWKDSPPLW